MRSLKNKEHILKKYEKCDIIIRADHRDAFRNTGDALKTMMEHCFFVIGIKKLCFYNKSLEKNGKM